jgi:hypothetical protein
VGGSDPSGKSNCVGPSPLAEWPHWIGLSDEAAVAGDELADVGIADTSDADAEVRPVLVVMVSFSLSRSARVSAAP